jgi:hypothetical protein
MGWSYKEACRHGVGHLHPLAPGNRPATNAAKRKAQELAESNARPAPGPSAVDCPGPWTITIERWTPPSVNRLLTSHWAVAAKLKKTAAELIAYEARNVPRATGKRRVSMSLTIPHGGHRLDPDNAWKAVLDALKHAGMILDDGADQCELGSVVVAKGQRSTAIMLEEVPLV